MRSGVGSEASRRIGLFRIHRWRVEASKEWQSRRRERIGVKWEKEWIAGRAAERVKPTPAGMEGWRERKGVWTGGREGLENGE
jgi:hypothetical protein